MEIAVTTGMSEPNPGELQHTPPLILTVECLEPELGIAMTPS